MGIISKFEALVVRGEYGVALLDLEQFVRQADGTPLPGNGGFVQNDIAANGVEDWLDALTCPHMPLNPAMFIVRGEAIDSGWDEEIIYQNMSAEVVGYKIKSL